MTDYERLTEISRELHGERELLIDQRRALNNSLQALENRLHSLDVQIEGNLFCQEMYWPNFDVEQEMHFTNDVVKEYYANPDITAKKLAIKLHLGTSQVTAALSKHFKQLTDKVNNQANL